MTRAFGQEKKRSITFNNMCILAMLLMGFAVIVLIFRSDQTQARSVCCDRYNKKCEELSESNLTVERGESKAQPLKEEGCCKKCYDGWVRCKESYCSAGCTDCSEAKNLCYANNCAGNIACREPKPRDCCKRCDDGWIDCKKDGAILSCDESKAFCYAECGIGFGGDCNTNDDHSFMDGLHPFI
ncbi:OLC1v1022383C1 [Oldenlandia corymbosa var. corymbosa]|uniref:OLC1v1022383C1 n=1 Tax=Oldenlandia corymbosa var. corymbosa TaxID=529605 RepID=A0AAV1C040_OLDCO|nr:OLC1v1022383C1 [Oldenlandia corymbosa var. corymbosa]